MEAQNRVSSKISHSCPIANVKALSVGTVDLIPAIFELY